MSVDHAKLSWQETSPSVWQRDLDEVELFWAKVAKLNDFQGRRPFEVTGHVSLDIQTAASSLEDANEQVDSALKKAWIMIRNDHPTVASHTEYDFSTEKFVKTYRVNSSEEETQEWIRATLVQVSGYSSGRDFANADPPAPKLPSMFVISPEARLADGVYYVRRDLVLRAAHDTIDGAGTLLLLGNFLRHAASQLDDASRAQLPHLNGSETSNLSPPYRIAAGIPPTPTPAIQHRIEQMVSDHVHYGPNAGSGHLPALGLPFKNQDVLAPSQSQRVEIVLDALTVAKLLAACKDVGATVTHIFHAAIPIVMRDLQETALEEQRFNYVFDLLYNLRKFCDEPYNTPAHAVTAYHSGSSKGARIEMVVPASGGTPSSPASDARKEEFARVLSEIISFYKYVRDDLDQGQLAPYMWASHLSNMPKVPRTPPLGPPPGDRPTATVSSLGVVDAIVPPQIGQISTHCPWITGEEMSNQLGLFLVTHRGELSLACAYNAAWHERGEALDFLQRCKGVVFDFLGMKE